MPDGNRTGAVVEMTAFTAFQNSPDYVIVLEPDGTLCYANPSFCERFCPGGLAPGRKFTEFLDTPSARRITEMSPQLYSEPRRIDLNHRMPDASTVTVQYSFFPLPPDGSGRSLLAGIGRERSGDLGTLLEVIQLNLRLSHRERELEEANARLELLSHTDQITQIYNRHYFFQVAQHFWEESRRYKLPLTVMMMDLDDFKSINDRYGHLFGDYVLQQVAARLKSITRKVDILARYGGEEIVLLAPNTDLATGKVLADRLRLAVASEPYVMGACSSTVTISVGISGTELDEFASFEALLDSSDQALYSAKSEGKNRVCEYPRKLPSSPETKSQPVHP
ncbi:MAG TPA: diguanylate cyclase [Terriglobia bacterium]|nr:diguanylate cyclase [Terriglobia bacterium]